MNKKILIFLLLLPYYYLNAQQGPASQSARSIAREIAGFSVPRANLNEESWQTRYSNYRTLSVEDLMNKAETSRKKIADLYQELSGTNLSMNQVRVIDAKIRGVEREIRLIENILEDNYMDTQEPEYFVDE